MAEIRVKETGTIKLFESDNTSSVTIASPASLGGDRTITLPDASVTLASGTMLATDGSGASLTALNASELGSGTVPTARLGSGTASSSTILYGDQTYKTEPSGFDVTSITGQTALDAIPDNADEFVLSDGGTLKRIDYKYLVPFNSLGGCFTHGNQTDITDSTYVKILLSSTKFNRGLTFGSSTITIPAGGDGDYYCSVFIDFNTYAYGAFGAGTVAVYVNGSGVKYASIDTRKAADDYNARSGHVAFAGILGDLNATDTIDIYAYVLMDQGTASYRAANGTMVTLFKVNND